MRKSLLILGVMMLVACVSSQNSDDDDPGAADRPVLGLDSGILNAPGFPQQTASGAVGATFTQLATAPSADLSFGVPAQRSSSNFDVIVQRDEYSLSYNLNLNVPMWVAWRVRPGDYAVGGRYGMTFPEDRVKLAEAVNAARTRLSTFFPGALPAQFPVTGDYTNTGYDRGHMTNSGDRSSSEGRNLATFFLSNITPQAPSLNRRAWLSLEDYTRDMTQGTGGRPLRDAYVIAGSIFGTYTSFAFDYRSTCDVNLPLARQDSTSCLRIGTRSVQTAVPAAFFKVVIFVDRVNGREADPLAVAAAVRARNTVAVIMPNPVPASAQDRMASRWGEYQVTIDDIEARTGLDILAALTNTQQATLERTIGFSCGTGKLDCPAAVADRSLNSEAPTDNSPLPDEDLGR